MNLVRYARDSSLITDRPTEFRFEIVDRLVLERWRKVCSISQRMPQDKFLCQQDKFSPMLVVQGKSFDNFVKSVFVQGKSLTVNEEPREEVNLTHTIRVFLIIRLISFIDKSWLFLYANTFTTLIRN